MTDLRLMTLIRHFHAAWCTARCTRLAPRVDIFAPLAPTSSRTASARSLQQPIDASDVVGMRGPRRP